MRTHRAFVSAFGPSVRLEAQEFEHLRVLRAQVGDALTVFDGSGLEAGARIVEFNVSAGFALLELAEPHGALREPPQPVTLAVALLKADKLADVVRACTELGVTQFQLLVTQHADVREIGAQKFERLRRIALEASKQCQRNHVPEVLAPVALTRLVWSGVAVVAHPQASVTVQALVDWQAPVTLLSGPEGGFSQSEIVDLERRGAKAVVLGPRILRAETAPVALVAALTAAQGW